MHSPSPIRLAPLHGLCFLVSHLDTQHTQPQVPWEWLPLTLVVFVVFILGFGAIGIELARRLRPFGVKIIATRRNWSLNDTMLQKDEIDGLVDQKGLPQDIYEFAGEADIVVTCLTLYSKTGSFVVNVARGGILNYTSVLQHLNSGHLGGLAIDVAWSEPFDPEDPILKFPNVLITPHVAGVTEFSYRKMAKVVADTAIQLHEGSPITGLEFVN
ncbi:hypothetical protein HPP92_003335 [Vanilla planifolia]|uniref:D-isomer specific 2-hydroxyacid dehydrogenase NAD-binding domain-containing protein n=1 Tax=Vanilla planifolia TaxID=51239 RepID=A0A835S612_VANPL|nr:hypothetical protein HPP92_003335 [Vanilla planifolia]